MDVESEKLLLLKMHKCSEGVDDEALAEIASHARLLRCESGDMIHRAEDVITSVYLVVQGRIKQAAMNLQGKIFLERIYSRGEQFGGLAAALSEPIPVEVTSSGPSILLEIDYQKALELTLKYPQFRMNLTRLIARGAQQAIFGEKHRKRPSLVGVFHDSPASRELTARLIRRLQDLGENPCLLTDHRNSIPLEGVPCRSLIEEGRALTYEEVRQQAHDWSDSTRVFLDLSADFQSLSPSDVLQFCEHVFWCIEPHLWERAAKRLNSIGTTTSIWREKITIVWLLNGDQQSVPVVPNLKELVKEDCKISIAERGARQSQVLANGVERLVHELRGIRIGVALGGGAARGMAHLGVLKALEQQGIVVDMIAGTSAGAMTGTVIAAAMEHDYCIESFVHDLTPSWLFRKLPRGTNWYLLCKYRLGHFDPMLRKYLGDVKLEQLPLPMHTITVDLVTGQPVVRSEGDAVDAILESINLPVLSLPICRNGSALVDGGLINNVPTNVLVECGCNFVIAVSVTAKLESRFGKNRPDTPTEKMKSPSTLQTVLRSYLVQSVNMNTAGVEQADFVIEPDVTTFDLAEFTRTGELAAVGELATLETIPQINRLLNKLDPELFPAVR